METKRTIATLWAKFFNILTEFCHAFFLYVSPVPYDKLIPNKAVWPKMRYYQPELPNITQEH